MTVSVQFPGYRHTRTSSSSFRIKTLFVAQRDAEGSRTSSLMSCYSACIFTSFFWGERLFTVFHTDFTSGIKATICFTFLIFPAPLNIFRASKAAHASFLSLKAWVKARRAPSNEWFHLLLYAQRLLAPRPSFLLRLYDFFKPAVSEKFCWNEVRRLNFCPDHAGVCTFSKTYLLLGSYQK